MVCVCFNRVVLTGAEDLIPAAAPSSQGVIWKSRLPPLTHIDFWLCGFYVHAEFSTDSEKTPPPPCPLFSVQMKYWWEALAPFFFIYSFTHSLSLCLSLSLGVLTWFSRPFYLVYHHFLCSCDSGAILRQMVGKKTSALFDLRVWICVLKRRPAKDSEGFTRTFTFPISRVVLVIWRSS